MPRAVTGTTAAVLSDAHLKAIGRVAAEWSALEFSILVCIAELSSISLIKCVMLVGPLPFGSWIDLIKKSASVSTKHRHKMKELTLLCNDIQACYTERNNIVHCHWHAPRATLASLAGLAKRLTAKTRSQGMGIPKRGKSFIIPIDRTAVEIRTIATKAVQLARRLDKLIEPSVSVL